MFKPNSLGWFTIIGLVVWLTATITFTIFYINDQTNITEVQATILDISLKGEECTGKCNEFLGTNCVRYEHYTCYNVYLNYSYTYVKKIYVEMNVKIPFNRDDPGANRYIKDHPVNSTLTIYVDSDDPSINSLTKREISTGWFGLIALGVLCYCGYCTIPCCICFLGEDPTQAMSRGGILRSPEERQVHRGILKQSIKQKLRLNKNKPTDTDDIDNSVKTRHIHKSHGSHRSNHRTPSHSRHSRDHDLEQGEPIGIFDIEPPPTYNAIILPPLYRKN